MIRLEANILSSNATAYAPQTFTHEHDRTGNLSSPPSASTELLYRLAINVTQPICARASRNRTNLFFTTTSTSSPRCFQLKTYVKFSKYSLHRKVTLEPCLRSYKLLVVKTLSLFHMFSRDLSIMLFTKPKACISQTINWIILTSNRQYTNPCLRFST